MLESSLWVGMVLVLNEFCEFGGASRAKNLKVDFTGSYSIFGSRVWKKLKEQLASPSFRKSTPSAEAIKANISLYIKSKLQDNHPYQ